MKTYLAQFTGRPVGAIGTFDPYSVITEGETPEAAQLALYQTHEHITDLRLDPVAAPCRTPFDADSLVLLIQNDAPLHDSVRRCVQRLQDVIDRAAEQFAQANREWHDDPEADDHAAFQADSLIQLPRYERTKAIKELIDRHIDTINENAGRQFWPEDFAKLKAGDFVRLRTGIPAIVEAGAGGNGNAWITVCYRMEPGGPLCRRSCEWNEIDAANPAA